MVHRIRCARSVSRWNGLRHQANVDAGMGGANFKLSVSGLLLGLLGLFIGLLVANGGGSAGRWPTKRVMASHSDWTRACRLSDRPHQNEADQRLVHFHAHSLSGTRAASA